MINVKYKRSNKYLIKSKIQTYIIILQKNVSEEGYRFIRKVLRSNAIIE